MRCYLYSNDGRLLREGLGGLRRDGAIVMAAERRREPVHAGGTSLVLVEGGRRFAVLIEAVHDPHDAALAERYEVYRLTPVGPESAPGVDGAGAPDTRAVTVSYHMAAQRRKEAA